MRMSCNGCRALRKGCSKDCTLGPSLQWIKSPQSQANATLFLAKFYGRAGLINLINAGPSHLRPEILRSLLYEACGRIINPIYGSVGLVCSGNWPRCQAAVEAVLEGTPVVMNRISGDDHDDSPIIPLQGCDIRHLSKDQSPAGLHRIRSRQRFKRSSSKSKFDPVGSGLLSGSDAKFTITGWNYDDEDQKEFSQGILNRGPSQDSLSAETLESVLLNRVEQPVQEEFKRSSEIGLELTLGFNPVVQQTYMSTVIEISDSD